MFFEDVTPMEKLYEIICNASPILAKNCLEDILLRLAACELAMESAQIDENSVNALLRDAKTVKLADSLAIDAMAAILSRNE